MKRIEYRTVDKSDWATRGPWDDEPDKVQWQDEATGLPCLIVRGPAGALCGYVGIPKTHPLHGGDYDGIYDKVFPGDVEGVHGGLTFAGPCRETSHKSWMKMRQRFCSPVTREEVKRFPIGDSAKWMRDWEPFVDDYEGWMERVKATAVCHIPEKDEPDDVWWFGFDCAHAGDFCPAFEKYRLATRDMAERYYDDEVYRDVAYVTAEVARLAGLLKDYQPEARRLIIDE